MVKIDGGLRVPIKVKRGMRQGCPLSGQLNSLVIEPLLCKLREQLTGSHIEGSNILNYVKCSAYTDVTVIIRNSEDIKVVLENLKCYGRASSAKLIGLKVKPYGVVQRDLISHSCLIMLFGEEMDFSF